ncbi:hypothetical protein P7K49_025960 [Saguinus oedipus]|uniref:Uncharacterized protein n=1 Tax=Saguinus oedipus TaxID=9490 RepID=A0ABQ9UIQ1_SAGOE|nr:hypothetical protein P7K49_025960 [Saguinus oedipus]
MEAPGKAQVLGKHLGNNGGYGENTLIQQSGLVSSSRATLRIARGRLESPVGLQLPAFQKWRGCKMMWLTAVTKQYIKIMIHYLSDSAVSPMPCITREACPVIQGAEDGKGDSCSDCMVSYLGREMEWLLLSSEVMLTMHCGALASSSLFRLCLQGRGFHSSMM